MGASQRGYKAYVYGDDVNVNYLLAYSEGIWNAYSGAYPRLNGFIMAIDQGGSGVIDLPQSPFVIPNFYNPYGRGRQFNFGETVTYGGVTLSNMNTLCLTTDTAGANNYWIGCSVT